MDKTRGNDFSEGVKKQRDKFRVEIKKKINEATFALKRNKHEPYLQSNLPSKNDSNPSIDSTTFYNPALLESIYVSFKYFQISLLLENLKIFRASFSIEPLNIKKLIEIQIFPLFMEIGMKCDDLEIQFEIGWIIVNAVSGEFEEIEELLRNGMLDVLEKQMSGEDEKLREQVLWALANISGDQNEKGREIILNSKVLEQAINVTLTFPCSPIYLENLIWLLTNVTRVPSPDFKKVYSFLPLVEYLIGLDEIRGKADFEEEVVAKQEEKIEEKINRNVNERVLEGTMQIFYNICLSAEVEEKNLRDILDMQFNVIEFIVNFVSPCASYDPSSPNFSIRLCQLCMKVLGVLLTGDNKTTLELINLGALNWLIKASKSESSKIRKDVFWSLSNVACCEPDIIGLLYEEEGLLKRVFEAANSDPCIEVRQEAILVLINLTITSTEIQISLLYSLGLLPSILSLLSENSSLSSSSSFQFYPPSTSTLSSFLSALETLLQISERQKEEEGLMANRFCVYLQEGGWVSKLEELAGNGMVGENVRIEVEKIVKTIYENS